MRICLELCLKEAPTQPEGSGAHYLLHGPRFFHILIPYCVSKTGEPLPNGSSRAAQQRCGAFWQVWQQQFITLIMTPEEHQY